MIVHSFYIYRENDVIDVSDDSGKRRIVSYDLFTSNIERLILNPDQMLLVTCSFSENEIIKRQNEIISGKANSSGFITAIPDVVQYNFLNLFRDNKFPQLKNHIWNKFFSPQSKPLGDRQTVEDQPFSMSFKKSIILENRMEKRRCLFGIMGKYPGLNPRYLQLLFWFKKKHPRHNYTIPRIERQMGYWIKCSQKCSSATVAAEIVDLLDNYTDYEGRILCRCGNHGYIEKEYKLQTPPGHEPEYWEPVVKGAIRLNVDEPGYALYMLLVAEKPNLAISSVLIAYYKDQREEGGRLKHGHGPGAPPVLDKDLILSLISQLVRTGFISTTDICKVLEG